MEFKFFFFAYLLYFELEVTGNVIKYTDNQSNIDESDNSINIVNY